MMLLKGFGKSRPVLSPWQTAGISFTLKKESENLYSILKIKPASTQKEIKLAYYQKAKEFHPDFNQSDQIVAAEKFKRIHKAYEVLSNPIARQTYDMEN